MNAYTNKYKDLNLCISETGKMRIEFFTANGT